MRDENARHEALRIGPRLTVYLQPDTPLWPWIPADRLQFSFSAYPAYEVFSRRWLLWTENAAVYNLDNDGNIAVTLSYKRGYDADTGNKTNLVKLGLSTKLLYNVSGPAMAMR